MSRPKLGDGHEVAGIYCAAWWRERSIFDRLARAIAGEAMKKRRSMTTRPKHRNAPKVARRRGSVAVGLTKKIALLTHERDEALEQQRATAEVLRVISSSPGELQPVFQTMLKNATRICEAKFGVLHRYENNAFRPAAWVGVPQPLAEYYRQLGSFQPPAGSPLDRLLQAGGAIYTADETAESNSSPARTRWRAVSCCRADAQGQ